MISQYAEHDKIYIRDLLLRCIIGINEEERHNKQDVIINITLFTDLAGPCKSDNIDEAVDYKTIKLEIIKLVENSSYNLLEKLTEEIAALCLQNKKVAKVKVSVDKPAALRFARSVAVEITRYNKNA